MGTRYLGGEWETGNGKGEIRVDEKEFAQVASNKSPRRIPKSRSAPTGQASLRGRQVTSKPKELKIILVNKEERQDLEKVIWQKVNNPETEVCYIFKKKESKFYVP